MSSAKTVNQIIQSRHIGHQVGLLRLSTGITKKVAVLLNQTEDRLLDVLRGIGNQRLNTVLKNIRIVFAAANPEMNRLLTKELTDLASYETEFASSIIKGAIPIKMEMAMPSVNALSTIVTATPFEGKLLKEWVEDISESQRKAIRGVIRSGMVEGQTISQMARRIRGTRKALYRDGIMETTRRGSQAMVRTAVNHTATQSRDLLYQQNEDMISKVQILATLDGRTCFTAGHSVLMVDHSLKNIEDIVVDDIVVGGITRQPRKVKAIQNVRKSTVAIHLDSGYTITSTPEHLFLIKNGENYEWTEARDLTNLCLLSYIPEQENICRSVGAPQDKISRACQQQKNEIRQISGSDFCDKKVWDRFCSVSLQKAKGLCRSILDGANVYRKVEYNSAKWVQFNKRWGRRNWLTRVYKKRERAKVFCEMEGRSRICKDGNKANKRNCWTKNIHRFIGLVGFPKIREIEEDTQIEGIQEKNINCKREYVGGEQEERGRQNTQIMGRSYISREGEFSTGKEAGRIADGQRMGAEEKRENSKDYERKMARSSVYRTEKRVAGTPRSQSKVSAKWKNWGAEAVGAKVIRIEQKGVQTVYDIQVESPDCSFVCEGFIVHNSPICQDMDGTTWPVNSGPRPPFHINCRTTTCPVVKSWRELGIDIDEAPAGTRASMNGQVPAKTTYNEWLKGQPAKVQDDILGPSRGQMFRDGTHSVSNFVDRQTGRHYTLKELAKDDGIKVAKKVPTPSEFVPKTYETGGQKQLRISQERTAKIEAMSEKEYEAFRQKSIDKIISKNDKNIPDLEIYEIEDVKKGLAWCPANLLEDMAKKGYTIDFNAQGKYKYRSYFQNKAVHMGKNSDVGVIGHEWSHAVDTFFSGDRSTGFAWKNGRYVSKKQADVLLTEYRSLKSGKIGTFTNGDGNYNLNNWLHAYEGTINSHPGMLGEGQEWLAMNFQRYTEYKNNKILFSNEVANAVAKLKKLKADPLYKKNLEYFNDVVNRAEDKIKALNTLGAEKYAAQATTKWGTWAQAKEMYPKLTKFIEDNFSDRTFGGK